MMTVKASIERSVLPWTPMLTELQTLFCCLISAVSQSRDALCCDLSQHKACLTLKTYTACNTYLTGTWGLKESLRCWSDGYRKRLVRSNYPFRMEQAPHLFSPLIWRATPFTKPVKGRGVLLFCFPLLDDSCCEEAPALILVTLIEKMVEVDGYSCLSFRIIFQSFDGNLTNIRLLFFIYISTHSPGFLPSDSYLQCLLKLKQGSGFICEKYWLTCGESLQ